MHFTSRKKMQWLGNNEVNLNVGGIILLTKIRVKIQFKFYIRTNGTFAKSYSAPEKNKHIQKKHGLFLVLSLGNRVQCMVPEIRYATQRLK